MKKILFALAALAIGVSASAQNAEDLRIYINPGHGSWTPNDRPMSTIREVDGNVVATTYSRTSTDSTAFFESNTNLRKGFGVLESLRTYGLKFDPTLNQTGERWQIGAARDLSNNIVMSHVKCGPYHEDNGSESQLGDATPEDLEYYNRSLSEICQEVDANNFDMFISIHSNALSDGTNTNYPLFLYRGYDTPVEEEGLTLEHQNTSIAMADACWEYWFANPHMSWSYYSMTNQNIRGDINFMGSFSVTYPEGPEGRPAKGYYGVLRHHTPGFLVEGYFHTYQPGRHKAMNFDACYLEGVCYAHGIADYFKLTKETTGNIYGVVRDKYETFTHDCFKPNVSTDDKYLHLNGVKVILKKDGVEVANYTTDNFYNGIFVFKNVEPGNYTLQFESEQYLPLEEELAVEVKAADIVYPTAQLVNKDWTPPAIVYVNYPDEIDSKAIGIAGEYNMAQDYVDAEIAELAGKTVRRTILRNENLYILAVDEANAPTVLIYDTNAKTVTTLGTSNVVSNDFTLIPLSDIQLTADGVLVGTSKSKTHFNEEYATDDNLSARGEVYIYKWANDETTGLPAGEAELWITSLGSANQYAANTGESFLYKGTLKEGVILLTSANRYNDIYGEGGTERIWYQMISVIEGQLGGETFQRPNDGKCTNVGAQADGHAIYLSPVDEEEFFIAGNNKCGLIQFHINCDADGLIVDQLPVGILEADALNRVGFFKYAGHSMMVAAAAEDGKNVGIKLIDITDGLGNAKLISTVNTTLEASDLVNATATGTTVVERDEVGEFQSAYMNLVLTRGNKVSRFTTKGVEQPKVRAEYAYDLNMTNEGANYTFTFKVTGDVVDANILLTNADNEETVVVPVGSVTAAAGAKVTYDANDLNEGSYTWAVEVESRAIGEAAEIFAPGANYTTTSSVRGGVVIINDPEYDTFGHIVIGHGRAQGFDLYNPAGEQVGERKHAGDPFQNNQSSVFRGDDLRGKAVFADWSDGASGYWMIDPANFDAGVVQMVQGERGAHGEFVYNGAIIGGGSSSVAFQGKGENTKMYTFEEDLEFLGAGTGADNILVRYNIGESDQITAGPDFDFGRTYSGTNYFANTNVDVYAIEDGLFVTQCRGEGNNGSSVPGFLYMDNEGNIKLNSADVENLNSCNSAVALTADRKTMAIGTYTGIQIYSVEWADNVPTLTYLYGIANSAASWADLEFDTAGNLHAYLLTTGYRVYSLVNSAPKAVTAAKAAQVVTGLYSSIIDIEDDVEVSDAPAVYYNLQGIQVANPENGIYIVVRGNKVTKEYIK